MAAATVAAGVAAGVAGTALTVLLHLIQYAAFGYTDETFLVGVLHASPLRRVAALAAGGLLAGAGWWLYRRLVTTPSSVTAAVAGRDTLPIRSAAPDAVLQILAVGSGASLGREGAPRQLGAALGGWLADRLRLDAERRRLLLACGAGAGLAAVYNVPLGGTLFTLEVLLASRALRDVVPAAVTAAIATVVSWPVLGTGPTYALPRASVSAPLVVLALLLGPMAGLAGVAFNRLTTAAREHAPTGWRIIVAIPLVLAALGGIAAVYPALLGNGKALADLAFTGRLPLTAAAVLLVLKPVATAACLRAGAIGGLLTPSLATGAVLGVLAGAGWAELWPGAAPAACSLAGAAALLAVTQRAPLTATVLSFEFTHADWSLLAPVLFAVALAVATGRLLDRGRIAGSRGTEVASLNETERGRKLAGLGQPRPGPTPRQRGTFPPRRHLAAELSGALKRPPPLPARRESALRWPV